jgi:hypothetical protein
MFPKEIQGSFNEIQLPSFTGRTANLKPAQRKLEHSSFNGCFGCAQGTLTGSGEDRVWLHRGEGLREAPRSTEALKYIDAKNICRLGSRRPLERLDWQSRRVYPCFHRLNIHAASTQLPRDKTTFTTLNTVRKTRAQ